MAKSKTVWTVMIYLAGDNNLTTECLFALTEMKKALPGTAINVIAQLDPQDSFVPTHRYEINKSGPDSTIFDDIIDEAHFDPTTSEVCFRHESERARALSKSRLMRKKTVQALLSETQDLTLLSLAEEKITDETDTGSPITLYNFLSFCIQEYPADHYLVVLSGHSGGTNSDYLLTDESPRGSLTFNELKAVFKELHNDLSGQQIDIIGMDNCLMSMLEVCYEIRGAAKILVGCEGFSPASGWPYREILERLRSDFVDSEVVKKSSMVADFARAIVDEYTNYYAGYWMAGLSVAQSALDLEKIEELCARVNRLGAVLERELLNEYRPDVEKRQGRTLPHPFQDALLLAHWETQSYNGELFVDVYDFCDCLEKRTTSREVAECCADVKGFIESEFVLKSCFSGARYQFSYGVSIYFPWAQVSGSYWNLDFNKTSIGAGWGSFLNAYTLVTRREPRGVEKENRLSDVLTLGLNDHLSLNRLLDRQMVDRQMVDRQMVDRQMVDRQMVDRQMVDRQMVDRMISGGSANPVYSMRNPPIVFFPTSCIRMNRHVLAAEERFWGRPELDKPEA